MFIAARAARSPKLRRSGMFIGTGTNNDFRKIVRSGMEPFVWSPIRHAAPDGAWFSGAGALAINMPLLRSSGSLVHGGCASAINMPLLRSYGRRAAPDSSVTSGMFIATVPPEPHQLRRSGMFIAARAARSPKLRRSGMFIGTGTNNDFRKIVRSGMEPFVWSPTRHAAPDGAWFSGGASQL